MYIKQHCEGSNLMTKFEYVYEASKKNAQSYFDFKKTLVAVDSTNSKSLLDMIKQHESHPGQYYDLGGDFSVKTSAIVNTE